MPKAVIVNDSAVVIIGKESREIPENQNFQTSLWACSDAPNN